MHSAVKMLARLGRSGLFKRQFPQAGSKPNALRFASVAKGGTIGFGKYYAPINVKLEGGGRGGEAGHRAGF